MPELKNPEAEENAQCVVDIWKEHGRKKATEELNSIVIKNKLTVCERVMLTGRIFQIKDSKEF